MTNRISRGNIRKWVRKPENEKTWANFKTTFVEAHQELQDTDASVDELGFHSTNAIVDQIVQQLREDIPHDVPPLLQRNEIPITDTHQQSTRPPSTPPPIQQSVASTMQTDLSMATLTTTIMANMEAMRLRIKEHKNNGRFGRGRGRGRGRGGRGARARGRTQGFRRGGHY